MNAAEIDEVFNTFDEDGGGYMDGGEASVMIKKLQATVRSPSMPPPMSPPHPLPSPPYNSWSSSSYLPL